MRTLPPYKVEHSISEIKQSLTKEDETQGELLHQENAEGKCIETP